jgi:hypothetical protein
MTKPIDSAEAETLLVEYVEVYNKMIFLPHGCRHWGGAQGARSAKRGRKTQVARITLQAFPFNPAFVAGFFSWKRRRGLGIHTFAPPLAVVFLLG